MFLITNRKLTNARDLSCFGKTPNLKGPNELRLVEVHQDKNVWSVKPIDDKMPLQSVKQLKNKYHLDINENEKWFGSLKVACELYQKASNEKKSILFFVHGYNNDVEDVLEAAKAIEDLYDLIVVPFTWPANGGGVISGTASYLSDKSDALVSAGALNRTVNMIQKYHSIMTRSLQLKHQKTATNKHPQNPNAAAMLYTRLIESDCNVTINLLCHSMGNYLLKHTLTTSENATSNLVFDNICLVAADANNEDHKKWVGKLDVRKRVYVVINEDDAALRASRIKPGVQQKARLGAYLKKLNSDNATYIDLSNVKEVGLGHTYFKGDAVKENLVLKNLFTAMFTGKTIESLLTYQVDKNTFELNLP